MATAIGEKGLTFKNLKGVDGKNYSLGDFDSNKLLVIIFSCNHCPYVVAYEGRYLELASEFSARGVGFAAINANDPVKYPDDSFENMKKRAEAKQYPFPYLWDEDQSVARRFGATNTPHVFVLDKDRVLRYKGRIDDNWENPSKVKTRDLKIALEALLAQKEPPVTSTLPVGCSIKWK